MNNIIVRWYNKNRKKIWITILIIIFVIALINSLNDYYKKKESVKQESSSTNSTTTYNNDSYSIISGKNIDENTAEKSIDLIENFFEYCNNQMVEESYNLLSTECKEELYPTLEDFITKYYNKIFTEIKSYDSKLWITAAGKQTYRVEIMRDLLAAGQKDYMPIEEYYTITNENGRKKLNIKNFIGKQDINISKTENNITIDIICKKMYMDYETYQIIVQNNTGDKLVFNTKESTRSMYIEDENGLEYIAFLNEIASNELEIFNGGTTTFEIRFNRGYKPTTNIKKIVFEDISTNLGIKNMEIEL